MLKLYLVGLSYLLTVTNLVRCEPDYLFNYEARGWLKLHAVPDIWEEALLRCHYEGAVLASPLNVPLTKALHSLLQESRRTSTIFLGTHDLFSKGDFISIEGVPQDTFGSPSEHCVAMALSSNSSYNFKTWPCNNPLPYICYRKFDNQTMNECGTFDNAYQLNEHTGSCYKIHHERLNWTRAYRICAAEGSHLAIMNDDEEALMVRSLVPAKLNHWQGLHVGLVAWGEDKTWMTIHGDRIEDVYNDWDRTRYINEMIDDRYAILLDEGSLSPINGRLRSMFVCEKSPASKRFEAAPVAILELDAMNQLLMNAAS